LERDRAAAYFADMEDGSQILICSEIGSEGRNFQFSHHIILFDLPLNPDLLEQRIGRLDRIGQTQTITIHVPYLQDSAQEVMFHWYHDGLNAFEQTCSAGYTVYVQVESALKKALHQVDKDLQDETGLLSTTQTIHRELNEALEKGRDRLLEYNSCRPAIANELKQTALLQDNESGLQDYMDSVFDCFGIHTEEHKQASFIIQPTDHMISPFPGLPDDGLTITYCRDTALSNEDMRYLSWEHPMVTTALDMVLSSELGNVVVSAAKLEAIEPGSMLLETLFLIEATSNLSLQVNRYLPPTIIRIVIDEHDNNVTSSLTHNMMGKLKISSFTANLRANEDLATIFHIGKIGGSTISLQ